MSESGSATLVKAHVFIPWYGVQAPGPSRGSASFFRSVTRAVAFCRGTVERLTLHVHSNGTELPLYGIGGLAIPGAVRVDTHDPVGGKPRAIRFGAAYAEAWGADVVVVLDNDVWLPQHALKSLLIAFRRSSTGLATCTKAPLVPTDASEFQRLYSYSVQQSFLHGLLPRRPSASFYAISPALGRGIPDGCNEGDLFVSMPHAESGVVIFSPYPRTMDEEIRRRIRLTQGSALHGIRRFHDHLEFYAEARAIALPPQTDWSRFLASLSLWAEIRRIVDEGGR